MREFAKLLANSPAARAVWSILRQADLSAPELAWILSGRHAEGTVRHAVLELRRLGRVAWAGRRVAVAHLGIGRARVWKAKQ